MMKAVGVQGSKAGEIEGGKVRRCGKRDEGR
jgi:hypothetical protein